MSSSCSLLPMLAMTCSGSVIAFKQCRNFKMRSVVLHTKESVRYCFDPKHPAYVLGVALNADKAAVVKQG